MAGPVQEDSDSRVDLHTRENKESNLNSTLEKIIFISAIITLSATNYDGIYQKKNFSSREFFLIGKLEFYVYGPDFEKTPQLFLFQKILNFFFLFLFLNFFAGLENFPPKKSNHS